MQIRGKPAEIGTFPQRKKNQKRKENRPDGKVENAMKPRFPLSHRACCQRPEENQVKVRSTAVGGLSTAIIDQKPETEPAVPSRRDPADLVDAGHAAKVTAPKGAIRDVLCARLALASPSQEQTATPLKTVSLRTSSGDTGVGFAVGEYREAGVPPVLLVFNDFAEARAKHRVADRRPVLVVRSDEDPSKSYVLVKCESDSGKNSRSVKLGSARTLLKMAVGGGGKLAPDKDWTVDVSSRAESAGVWIVTPMRDLPSGEYGLWDIDGGGVALFGVD